MDFNEEKRSVTEGALMATEGTDEKKEGFHSLETEVQADSFKKRKKYTEGYKRKVVERIQELRHSGTGEIGGYLRQEGVYYNLARKWEKKFQMSENKNNVNKQVSGKPASSSREKELEEKVRMLEHELEVTRKKLQKSEMIIDFQKKISILLNPDKED
jgi:G:T/U-mismatch repair DNA glycosylase